MVSQSLLEASEDAGLVSSIYSTPNSSRALAIPWIEGSACAAAMPASEGVPTNFGIGIEEGIGKLK